MPNMFLKFHDIEGESLDADHPGEIEIKSWTWGARAVVKWELNQGGQCTFSTYDAIELTKNVDKASLMLQRCCLTGKHIRHATISCRKLDGDQKVEYLILKLKDVMVSKVGWTGGGGEEFTGEGVTLSCAEFEMDYKLQKDTGDKGGIHSFEFNIQTQRIGGKP